MNKGKGGRRMDSQKDDGKRVEGLDGLSEG